MLKKKKYRETVSKLFYFLPLTTDRKEDVIHHISNVNLHAIDYPCDNFQKLSPSNTPFVTSDLELGWEK